MSGTSAPLVFNEAQVRAAVSMDAAIVSARRAFEFTLWEGLAAPMPWHLEMPGGAVHVKGAAVAGSTTFAVKASSGFPGNAALGLPTSNGFSAVFDSSTGALVAVLLDNGYLTELRTGAAGGLAADLLAPDMVDTAAVIGTGGQARHQLEGLFSVRRPRVVRVCGRRPDAVAGFADWVRRRWNVDVEETTSPDEAVRDAQAVVTVTAADRALFALDSLAPDVHVTSVGSDTPGKRELPVDLLTTAALVAVDSAAQSQQLGELQGIDPESINRLVTMGQIVTERPECPVGRTVADLSGLGIQDTAIAAAALTALTSKASGSDLEKARDCTYSPPSTWL